MVLSIRKAPRFVPQWLGSRFVTMFVIEVRSKDGAPQRFEFDHPLVTIGRAEINDLVLPTASVSKRHAQLLCGPDGFQLADRQSANGTYVNGRRLLQPVRVEEGDHIHIGDYLLTIAEVGGALPTAEDLEGLLGAPVSVAGVSELALHRSALSPLPEPARSARSTQSPDRLAGRFTDRLSEQRPPASSVRTAQRSIDSARSPVTPTAGTALPRAGLLRGLRLPWLDDWLRSPVTPPLHCEVSSVISALRLVVHGRLPQHTQQGQPLPLRLWSEGGTSAGSDPAIAIEVNIYLPDGGLEVMGVSQGLLCCAQGRRSPELSFLLRGYEVGPARVEVGLSHRGARIGTLTLRLDVGPAHHGRDMAGLHLSGECEARCELTTLPSGHGPQLVLRVHEERGRRQGWRLVSTVCVARGEWLEPLAQGAVELPAPLRDRARALYGTEAAERLYVLGAEERELTLRAMGNALGEALLAGEVREALAGASAGALLQVDSPGSWVPWELLRVGVGPRASYLAERFALTRGGPGGCRFATGPRVLVTPEDAPFRRREQQALAALDPRLLRLHRLAEVLEQLREAGVAGWHISGHGAFDRRERSAAILQLVDGTLAPAQLAPAQRYHKVGMRAPLEGAFVFLCVSEPETPASLAPAGVSLWLERLMNAGVGAVVATSWPVHSAVAVQFAEVFYRAFGAGRPLAVAMAMARESVRSEGDPAWLSFAAYGVCDARMEA